MYTMMEYVKQVTNPYTKAVIMDFIRESDLFSVLPFVQVSGLSVKGSRWNTLPTVTERKVGGTYTANEGTTEQIEETLAILGGEIKVDRIHVGNGEISGGEDPLTQQTRMKTAAMLFRWLDQFINGDRSTTPDGIEGIKIRVSNMPSRQSVDLASAGDALKVLASTTTMHAFLDGLHEAIAYTRNPTHIICNLNSKIKLGAVLRQVGLLETVSDGHDRVFNAFAGIPILDIGLKSDQSTEIILDSEDPGDGGDDATSFYVVGLNGNDGLHGIEIAGKPIDPYDPAGGEMESAPQFIRRIDWPHGLFNQSEYAITRLSGMKMAAS